MVSTCWDSVVWFGLLGSYLVVRVLGSDGGGADW